jgi:cytidylate kinase
MIEMGGPEMTAPRPESAGAVAKYAEQQMRTWAIGWEVRDRLEHDRAVAQLPEETHPCVAVSRQAGTGGGEVARKVAECLHWQLVDRELLDHMADQYKLPKDMLQFVDETTSNWLWEVFGKWLDNHLVTQSEYVGHLGRIVLLAARHAGSVFVGRGAQFLLPREKRLTIRTVAPLNHRIERVGRERQLSHDQAKKYVADLDAGRHDFVRRYFHREADDATLYDLVINMASFDTEEAADLIVRQCRARFQL